MPGTLADIGREARATMLIGMTAEDAGNYAEAETLLRRPGPVTGKPTSGGTNS